MKRRTIDLGCFDHFTWNGVHVRFYDQKTEREGYTRIYQHQASDRIVEAQPVDDEKDRHHESVDRQKKAEDQDNKSTSIQAKAVQQCIRSQRCSNECQQGGNKSNQDTVAEVYNKR